MFFIWRGDLSKRILKKGILCLLVFMNYILKFHSLFAYFPQRNVSMASVSATENSVNSETPIYCIIFPVNRSINSENVKKLLFLSPKNKRIFFTELGTDGEALATRFRDAGSNARWSFSKSIS